MAVYQGFKSELMKSQRAYLPNDIILEFDDNKTNKVRMKVGKLHQAEIYKRLPYVSCFCECHEYGQGFVTSIGNGTDKEYIVEHNLNSNHIIIQVYDNITNILTETDINLIDENKIKVIFNNVPEQDQYRVLIYSAPYYTDPAIGNEDDLDYEIEHTIGTNDIISSVLNVYTNDYEHVQVKNMDFSSDKLQISFKDYIDNNQYLVSMEQGNYSQTITLTSLSPKTFVINHNLDCEDIIVQIYNLTFKHKIYSHPQVKILDKSNVEITFEEYEPEEFKDRCRMRIVLLDVRHIDGCYHIDANDIHPIHAEDQHEVEDYSRVMEVLNQVDEVDDSYEGLGNAKREVRRVMNEILDISEEDPDKDYKLSDKDKIPVILDWVSGTTYNPDDLVIYDEIIYRCIFGNSDRYFNENNWEKTKKKDLNIKPYN